MTAPSPRKPNAGDGSMLRLHPRGPPPLRMNQASLQPASSAGYPYIPVQHRSRMSPRQVKLQRMEPSPPYTIATPLRDQISTNFRHELFQFHQLLHDVIEANRHDNVQHLDSQGPAVISQDKRLLEILTSDRGDAVLKEFFMQWWRFFRRKRDVDNGEDDDGAILWEVLETFFSNLPFVVSEDEVGGASSPKSFFRYIDSLKSLRSLLISLLFKRSAQGANEPVEEDSDEGSGGLQSSIGLGFGLHFRTGTHNSPQRTREPRSSSRPKDRIPFYLYCQQLEKELEALRRRVPHRRPRSPGVVAGILGDVGLLQDNTVMLLLDFWGLAHEERLAFFCQIASQANEQDTSAILHVFLDNCSTQTFLQIWEALSHSPQFQKMIQEAKLQFEPAIEKLITPTTATPANEKENAVLEAESTDTDRPVVWRGSQRGMRKRGRRSTRFVDLNGITEAFDFTENDEDSSEEKEDLKNGRSDSHRDSPRFQKFTIRERGRLSLSDASDRPEEENQRDRRDSLRRNDRSRRRLKTPKTPIDRDSVPLLELLHNDLTEIIKMENGPDVHVMDAIWQLLETLDGHKMHDSKSGYHRRHVPVPAPVSVPVQPPQQVVVQNARASLHTPLSAEQQFLMKLDQLQSMLVALGDVRVHTMSTETITGAYRRIPILAKLFAALSDTSLGAAGVDTAGGGMSKVVSNYGKAQHLASSWQSGAPKDTMLDPFPSTSEIPSITAGDDIREDVEAMGLLLVKLSKFVRSLAPLVDNEDSVHNSAADNVLTVMDLATKLECAGTLAESPGVLEGGGKRRFSLAVDRELPILLAVQSLARSNDFDNVSQMVNTAVKRKLRRAQVESTAEETKENDDDDDDDEDSDTAAMEGDEEVLRIVKNIRRASAKAAQSQEIRDQMKVQVHSGGIQQVQSGGSQQVQSEGSQQIDPNDSDTAASTVRRFGKGDIPTSIKNAAVLRDAKLFSADILLRVVNQLYRDSYEGMVSSLQYGNRRMEFSEFIYDWHIRKYGLKTLAQRHLLKLIQSLRKHEKKVFQCQLPLGFHEHKFVLGLLSRWSLGTFLGGSKHRLKMPKRQFKIRISFAVSTVQESLRERFGVYARGMDALADRIRAQALPRDDEFIRESDLLTMCVEEFGTQRALLEKVLGAVYMAGDINGDGSLEFDEFASVVTHLSPTVDDRFLQKVFEAAHDFTKPRRISFARFLDVILLERVLSPAPLSSAATGIARAKNAAAAAAASSGGSVSTTSTAPQSSSTASKVALQDEQEETYQFELLRETWINDREAVTQVLQTSITHAPTAKSLSFRVAFLDHLLDRRVDAKTAWLCHRQIMREISRYQHLDADQVAGLRRKELQFKKTVRAIRNVQRLSALFVAVRDSADEAGAAEGSGAIAPNYTAAVRQSLDTQTTGIPDVADVAALENELRETFLERADEGAIDDYMEALQHLRRVSLKQQSLQLQFEDFRIPVGEALTEGNEESDTDDDDESKVDEVEYDGEEDVGPS
ncbi:hypothetical protein P3T76_010153 [Phytophthora citrophthora]|uniref:EF-hand domain-containing protein n=1 Tax=Phytophthora citrophthora TaxID=4793 RepID=A0AAD9GE18_9STRA|nr:hypothetical protein P3T76_010153 [Phytophthora citrophthora]